MDPVTGGAAMAGGAAAARILGALIGRAIAEGDYQRAEALQKQALEQYGSVDPNVLMGVDVQAGGTELDKYVEDPEAKEAQMMALRRMGEMTTGDDPESTAAYAQSRMESGAHERGIREAAMRRLAERGVGGNSGLALAAQLNAAQSSITQKNMGDLQTASDSRRRALAALGQYGNMAGNIRGQNYNQAADRAAAQDAINKFNAGQRFNQAKSTFGNQMDVADAKADQYGALANRYDAYGDRTQQTYAGVGDAVGDALDSAGKKGRK